MQSVFLTAEWRKLAIINYSVDPSLLTPYLPYKTELDLWYGKCYVSLVGFRFINTRLKGILIPFHGEFEEVNLRFYVRFKDGSGWKRGVSFIKEIVPKPALTIVANAFYREKYVTLPTRSAWTNSAEEIKVSYAWKHKGGWDSMSMVAGSTALNIPAGSEEEFITEHYWGYTRLSGHQTSEYQVEHPRWMIYPVKNQQIVVRFGELYGSEFGMLKDAIPDSVILAEGSEIAVRVSGRLG